MFDPRPSTTECAVAPHSRIVDDAAEDHKEDHPGELDNQAACQINPLDLSQEDRGGKSIDWMELVEDDIYLR